jgi:hypothetical protein
MLNKKLFFSSLIAFAIVLILVSQGFAQVLTIATDPMGSGTYGCTAGLASILNKYSGLNIKVKSTAGATEAAPLLAFGEVELATLSSYEAKMSYLTKGYYEEPLKSLKISPFRLLMGGPPTFVSVVVREDSGIKTGPELKGKRFVGIYTGSEGCTLQGMAFLASWGLSPEDVIMIQTPGLTESIEVLIEGKAEAAGTSAPGQAILKELDSKRGARFLNINNSPEGIKAYQDIYPASIILLEPAPDLTGVKEPTYMAAFEDLLVANKDLVSEEVAYNIVKTLWENNEEMMKVHVNLSYVTRDKFATTGAPMPFHPGAIKFYKEKGLWSPELEEKNQEFLKEEEAILSK